MKRLIAGGLVAAALGVGGSAAEAQVLPPIAVEVRGGYAIPTGDLGDSDVDDGLGFGVNAQLAFMPMLSAYVGWERYSFGIDTEVDGVDADISDSGFRFGLQAGAQAVLPADADSLDNPPGCRIIAAPLFLGLISSLAVDEFTGRAALKHPVAGTQLPGFMTQLATRQAAGGLDGGLGQPFGVVERVDQSDLACLTGVNLLAGEQQLEAFLQSDERRQPLRAAQPRQKAKQRAIDIRRQSRNRHVFFNTRLLPLAHFWVLLRRIRRGVMLMFTPCATI